MKWGKNMVWLINYAFAKWQFNVCLPGGLRHSTRALSRLLHLPLPLRTDSFSTTFFSKKKNNSLFVPIKYCCGSATWTHLHLPQIHRLIPRKILAFHTFNGHLFAGVFAFAQHNNAIRSIAQLIQYLVSIHFSSPLVCLFVSIVIHNPHHSKHKIPVYGIRSVFSSTHSLFSQSG